METKIHVFERAGLGRAPYRYLGCETVVYVACPGAPALPGGTCDFCGTAIKESHNLLSADGKRFHVGCDCIYKSGDGNLRRVVNAEKRKAQVAREDKRIEAAKVLFEANLDVFKAAPSPNKVRAEKFGESAFDFIEFMFRCAGHSGRLEATRYIEKVLGRKA